MEKKDIKTNLLFLYVAQNTRDVSKKKKSSSCVIEFDNVLVLHHEVEAHTRIWATRTSQRVHNLLQYSLPLWNSTPLSISGPHAVLSYAVSKQWSTFGCYRSSLETSQAEWVVLFHWTMALLKVLNSCAMLPFPHGPTPALHARKCSFVQLLISLTNWDTVYLKIASVCHFEWGTATAIAMGSPTPNPNWLHCQTC